MTSSAGSYVLAAAVVAGALVALFRTQRPQVVHQPAEPAQAEQPFDPSNEDSRDELPPGHPPIGASNPEESGLGQGQEVERTQPIVWKVPARWKSVPNPNAMRLATYHVPPARNAEDEAEVSVARAGGSTDANIQRWVEQFDDAGTARRTQKTIRGLRIAMVEVSGTFQGGGMASGGAPAAPRSGWTLKGAVVETDEGSFFFKLTGPSASVSAARADFDALISSISPAPASGP